MLTDEAIGGKHSLIRRRYSPRGKNMEKEKTEAGKTKTRNFVDYGKFTVRGAKAGEKLDIQSKYMTVDPRTRTLDMDAKKVALSELSMCLVDSPEGPHPKIEYLENLMSGIIETLTTDIKELSTPTEVVSKN